MLPNLQKYFALLPGVGVGHSGCGISVEPLHGQRLATFQQLLIFPFARENGHSARVRLENVLATCIKDNSMVS